MPKKPNEQPLTDVQIELRMERAIKKSFTMRPQPRKAKAIPARPGKRKTKS